MRSTLRQGSSSASSSVDLGSARQTETRVQRQLSGRKSDIETYRYDANTKHQRTGSSLSGTSSHAFPGLGLATSTHEEKMEVGVSHVESEVVNETDAATQEQLLVLECAGVADTCIEVEFNKRHGTMTASTSELSTHPTNTDLRDSSVASFSNLEDSASYGNGDLQNDVRCISDQEASAVTPKPSTMEDDTVLNSILDSVDVVDAPTQSSQNIISEIEIENGSSSSPSSQSDVSTDLESTIDELPEPSIANISDKNPAASVAKPDILNHSDDILEESPVTAEGHGRTKSRSLTLDEAADTILFCSSIVHSLAYEAATIAMEKENLVPVEGLRPMVTILGNSNSNIKDGRGRTTGKRASKLRKLRQMRVETDTKTPSGNIDSDKKVEASTTHIVGIPNKDDSLKPPKLESKCNCTVM
ncbi:Cordon-bleu protein-like [Actinidia chinensis var. chinensis]|uniref:Cordon-bleu protein-like n=1 Tax=Actinidia chinensis var. chinensis TaxID=1590841 RepID=A0A2R6P3C0_ACTCC|nr:Cordon-bleu protein-like [Actinidia chinensis var. chinensis]